MSNSTNLFAQDGNPVKVVARLRPLNQLEREKGSHITAVPLGETEIDIQAEDASHKFQFDRVFASHESQAAVYEAVVAPMVNAALEGFNSCIMAYGQTGASLELRAAEGSDDGVTVVGAAEVPVRSADEAMEVVKRGAVNRRVAETKMNRESSRSHSVLILMIAKQDGDAIRFSQLFVCDLAGSESAHKTQVSGTQLTEAGYINKSLLTLGRVIRALGTKKEHVPYRESKLTRVLASALGGNSLTALVVTLSPSSWNASESLSTLRFGSATRLIKNTPTANTLLKDENLEEALRGMQAKVASNSARMQWLAGEIDQLKAALGALGMSYADIQALYDAARMPAVPQLRPEWSTSEEGSSRSGLGAPSGGGGAAAGAGGLPGGQEGGDDDDVARPDTALANATHKSERDMLRTLAGSMSNVFLE